MIEKIRKKYYFKYRTKLLHEKKNKPKFIDTPKIK